MKKALLLLTTIFCFGLVQAQDKITLKQSTQYMNTDTEVIVEATIAQIKRLDRVAYINLGGIYPQQKLNLVILEKEFEIFENLLSVVNENKSIKVQGYITDYKDNKQPQILLTNAKQIEILE